MNNVFPAERLVRLAAFGLCALVYAAMLALIFQGSEDWAEPPPSMSSAVTLDIVQMELQAAVEAVPERTPEPEILPEPEEADVALEEVPKEKPKSEPEPEPVAEPVFSEAQVTQQAAAPVQAAPVENVQNWLVEQLEQEKYYPPAAERFGLTGSFDLNILVGADGTVLSAEVLEGGGHRILRQALENMLSKIIGLNYGEPVGEAIPFEFEFEFE